MSAVAGDAGGSFVRGARGMMSMDGLKDYWIDGLIDLIHSFIHSFTDERIASRRSVGGVRSVFRRHARAPEPTGPALGVFQILALGDVRVTMR